MKSAVLALLTALALAAGIFLLDTLTPASGAEKLLYLLPIAIAARWAPRWAAGGVTAWCTLLIVLAYVWLPAGHDVPFPFLNLTWQLVALWFVAWLLVRQVQVERALHARSRDLEQELAANRQTAAELRAAEARYHDLYDQAPDMYLSVQPGTGKILECNQTLVQVTGYSQAELIGQTVFTLYHPACHATAMQTLEQFRTTGSVRDVELSVCRKDGSVLDVSLNASAVRDDTGQIVRSRSTWRDITVHKRAQAELTASQAMYRLLAENSSDAVSLIDADGKVIYASPATMRRLGYTEDELVGIDTPAILTRIHPDDRAAIAAEIKRGRAEKLPTSRYEYRAQTKAGDYIWLEDHLRREFDAQGQIVGVIVNSRDITERRAVEQRLRGSETKFVAIFHALPIALSLARLEDRRLVDVNAAFTRLFGYSREEVLGRTIQETGLITPAAYAEALAERQGEKVENVELAVCTKAGERKTCLLSGEILTLAEGQLLLASTVDITERKEAEQRLRDSEERFRLVAENSPNIITIWAQNGVPVFVSAAAEQVLGWSPATILGSSAMFSAAAAGIEGELSAAELVALGFAPQHVTEVQELLATVRYCVAHPGERVHLASHARTVTGDVRDLETVYQGILRSAAGCEVVSVTTDVTAHKTLARMLQEVNVGLEEQVAARTVELQATVVELERANHAKNAFLAAVSHELRTPLTGILTGGELLLSQRQGTLTAQQERYLDLIMNSGRRLQETVNAVLGYTSLFAAPAPLLHERCRLAELCDYAALANQDKATAKNLTVTLAVTPPDLELMSHAASLTRLLTTLLGNAVKFTPEQGTVGITAGRAVGQAAVQLVVWDTGIGMTEEQAAQVFDPFVQGDQSHARQFEGMGLGLAYVHKLTELLGGSIAVASEPGKGSRFTVTLPAGGNTPG